MHGSIFKGDRLQLDFASTECQQEFYEHLNKANSELNSIPLVPNNSNPKTNQKPKPLPPTDSNCKKPTNISINIPCDSVIFTSNFNNISDLKKHFSVDFKNSCNTHNMTHNSNQKKPFENIQHTLLSGKHPLECTSSLHNNERHVLEYARHNYDPLLSPPHSSPESSQSSNSDTSQVDTCGSHLDDKLTNFNKKFEQWEKTRTNYSNSFSNVYDSTKYNYSNIIDDIEPSDIVKYILSKPSVFNEDSKRLEHLSIKYIIKKCISYQKPKCSSISLPPISETRCVPSSHSLPSQSIHYREASSTDSTILSTNPKLNASDLSLPAHLRGPFLTRNNNCVINSSLSKNASNQYNRVDIRAEYTKNWIIGSFSDFKKEKEDNIEIKKIDKKKLSEKFVIKKKNSNKTDLYVTPNVTEIQETQNKISDSIEIKSEYIAKITNEIDNTNIIKTIEENKPIKSRLILRSVDKINSISNENNNANNLSFDKYSLKITEPKDFKDRVECISSNKPVDKLSSFEKINKFGENSKETKSTKFELNIPKNNPIYNKNKEQPLINIHTQNAENNNAIKLHVKPHAYDNDEEEYLVNQPAIEDNANKIKIEQHTDEDVFEYKQIEQTLDKSDDHKKSERLEEYIVCSEDKLIPTVNNSKWIIDDDVKCTKKQIDTNCISSNSYSSPSVRKKTNFDLKNIEVNELSKVNSTHIKQNYDSSSSEILNIINKEQNKSREKTNNESNMIKILSQTKFDDNDNKEIIEKDEKSLPTSDLICTSLYDEVKSKSLDTNQLTSKK